MVDAYFRTKKFLDDAAVRQKIYYGGGNAPSHFKKGDWVLYWHTPTAMQTLYNGWTGPFAVTEYRVKQSLEKWYIWISSFWTIATNKGLIE